MSSCRCSVCESQNTNYVRQIKGQRTGKLFSLYFCQNCFSMFNPSGYKENNDALKLDLEWHINKFEDKKRNASELIQKLITIKPDARTFLDIGCGIGATVLQAKSFNLEAEGVEPNHFAVDYAKEKFAVDLKCNYFQESLYDRKFDLIICDQVLEHLENPQQLFKAAISSLNRPGLIYISVPFRKDPIRQIVYTAFPNLPGTLFFDNDVHITHFSHRSMKLWAEKFNADDYEFISIAGKGYIFYFN